MSIAALFVFAVWVVTVLGLAYWLRKDSEPGQRADLLDLMVWRYDPSQDRRKKGGHNE